MRKSLIPVLVVATLAASVLRAGERGSDELGEYWLSDDAVKHYYVFWDASTSAYNYNFSMTRDDAANQRKTYGTWKNDINGPIWTFGRGIAWPSSRYIGNFSVYGFHFESRERTSFRLEQETSSAKLSIGAYGIRSDVTDFSFRTYSNTRTIYLAESQTWAGPSTASLSSSPFYIVPGANDYTTYTSIMTAADDVKLTLEGDMVYAVMDCAFSNNLSNADIVIKEPAVLAFVGFWKNDQWNNSALKARSITIDGGTGIYFGKRTTNANGDTITMTQKVMNNDSWGRWGALGSAPQLTTNVASTIILKNGATLAAESVTTVSSGVKIVVPPGETAALKGTFSFADNLTEINLGEGAFLDISEMISTGSGAPKVTGKGTFGPESARYGTDSTGDWYIGNSLKKSYFLYQNATTGTRWSMESNSYTRKGAQDGAGSVNWVNDSIFTLERDTSYYGAYSFSGTKIVCGFLHEAPVGVRLEGGQVFKLGSYGIKSTSNNKVFSFWTSQANPVLTASQTWKGPDADKLSSTPYIINMPYTYQDTYRAAVLAEHDDIVWTLAGDMVLSMKTYTNDLSNADVVIKEPAILSLPSCVWGHGRLKARSLTIDGGSGIYFGKNTDIPLSGIGNGGFASYGIGSYELISPEQIAPVIDLKGNAALTAKSETTVEGGVMIVAKTGATAALVGTFKLADDMTVFKVESGAILDLTGATFVGTGKYRLVGAGSVRIDASVNRAADAAFDGVALELVGAGMCTDINLMGVSSLTVNSSDWFYLSDSELASYTGKSIYVTAGVLMLESAQSVPEGNLVVTSGDGKLALCAGTGFAADTQMGGTKNFDADYSAPLLVTDKPIPGKLSIAAGSTLLIFGNGLGPEAELELNPDTVVKFCRTATVGADMISSGSMRFTTVGGGITGTLAGTYVAQTKTGAEAGSVRLGPEPEDRLVIDGNWTINANGGVTFYMDSGEVEVHSTVLCKTSLNFRGGHLKVCDGGEWLLNNSWGAYLLDSQYMLEPCCLEVGTNGLVKIVSGNTEMRLGGKYEAKLLINGGTYYHGSDAFILYKNGIVEMNDGVFRTDRDITCAAGTTADNARFILSGGTVQCAGDYQNALFRQPSSGTGECSVLIDGNPTIALPWKNMSDVQDGVIPPCHWKCSQGSVLTLIGSRNTNVFKMHNFEADGLTFDIQSNSVKVELPNIAADEIELGWMLPGATSSGRIVATGTSPALKVSYVVPEGAVFDAGNIPESWHEGFASSALANLTFKKGSIFRFPYFGSEAVLALGGKLTLPDGANNYEVSATGHKGKLDGATVLTAAGGIVGDCTWTCTKGLRNERATLVAEGNKLRLSYDPLGAVMFLR